ncbi:MAG: SDR family oxidoreductase [Oligoflexales bacterium]|nr:SDR family oxidoreductase [Oligoflexales bacterium]
MKELDGKSALVTGCSGAIGRAIAFKLASQGSNIAIHYHKNLKSAQSLSSSLKEKFGIGTMLISSDLREASEVNAMVDQVIGRWPNIDILVNNAGTASDQYLTLMTEERWDNIIDINLTGAFHCLKAVIPHMIRAGTGKIVNMSSTTGICGMRARTNYGASKGALIGLTRSLAREFGPDRIYVNALTPGMIEGGLSEDLSSGQRKLHEAITPLSRFGRPEDVADAVFFLCSSLSDHITGEVITISGGEVTWYF